MESAFVEFRAEKVRYGEIEKQLRAICLHSKWMVVARCQVEELLIYLNGKNWHYIIIASPLA